MEMRRRRRRKKRRTKPYMAIHIWKDQTLRTITRVYDKLLLRVSDRKEQESKTSPHPPLLLKYRSVQENKKEENTVSLVGGINNQNGNP